MPQITLPDGSARQFANPVSVFDVAADIGAGLAKAALAGVVDGELVDTSHMIENDAALAIVTNKSDEALPLIRHSTAHLLAQAVKQLYPEAQVTIGPVVDDGFYYDFAYDRSFTPEDFEAIEKRMAELEMKSTWTRSDGQDEDESLMYWTLHDLKRKGISDSENKHIGGHKTEAMRQRYIVKNETFEAPSKTDLLLKQNEKGSE